MFGDTAIDSLGDVVHLFPAKSGAKIPYNAPNGSVSSNRVVPDSQHNQRLLFDDLLLVARPGSTVLLLD